MDCKEFKEKLFLYPEVENDFFLHLNECEECKKEFEFFLSIEENLKEDDLKEKISEEWFRIYKEVDRKLKFEALKRKIAIFVLGLLEVVLSILFMIALVLGYRVLRIFLSDFSLLVLTLKSVLQILSSLNFYLFVFLLVFLFYQYSVHKKF